MFNIDAYMIVVIDGKLSKKYSNINANNIIYLKKNILNKENYKRKKHVLNYYSGLIIYFKSNIKIKKPIYMLHISKKQIYKTNNLKIFVFVDKKLKIQMLEHYINKSKITNINNIKMEININNKANIAYYKLEELNKIDYYLSNIILHQKEYSQCEFYNINIYSYYLYNKVLINLKDEYSKCKVLGLFYPKNLIKNKIIINHKNNFTKSNVDYKGIINDTSKGFFNCYININNNIQNVYGFQKNYNILLSNNATIKTNPKLKIKSKDVVCTHKTIIGKINEDYIFYLRTRGINKNLAKTLILLSLINEILKKIEIKSLKKYLFFTKIKKLLDISLEKC